MKASKIEDYAQRIDRAVTLLTARLADGDAPSLDDLAGAAAMSKFHFHRVFRLLTGETVNDMVRRVRLAKGTARLDTLSATQAAGEAAYATSQAFARSMRGFSGMSVSEAVRTDGFKDMFRAPSGGAPLSIELAAIDPLQVIAIRNVGDYAQLDRSFGRLFEIAGGPENVQGIYGVYRSDPRFDPSEECVFDAALSLSSVPDDLGEAGLLKIGGGRYLRLRHLGDYDAIPLALDELTLAAIADESIEIGDAPSIVHYLDDPEECAQADLRADVCLPIEAR